MADVRALLRMAEAMVDLHCTSFRQVPKRIVLDIDDAFDAVHGGQRLRLFNAHHDAYGFQPIVVFDGEGRFVPRCWARPSVPLRRLLRAIRAHWPRVEILVRADGHYGVPEVIDLCRAMDVRFRLGAHQRDAPQTRRRARSPGGGPVCRQAGFCQAESSGHTD